MLKIAKPNFFVNEEKRTIVGKLIMPDDKELFDVAQLVDEVDKDFCYENLKNSYDFTIFEAKAKCCPEDKWDVEKGKAIVNERLGKMIIQRVKRQAKEERTKIINRISELDEIIKHCDKSIDNSNKHIDKIIKGE
jgi:hypothetical protein